MMDQAAFIPEVSRGNDRQASELAYLRSSVGGRRSLGHGLA